MTTQPLTYVDNAPKGEWNEQFGAFYFAGNGCEYMAFQNSHHVLVYDNEKNPYPAPPTQVVQAEKRIKTLEDFSNALDNGVTFEASYRPEGTPDPLDKLEAQIKRRMAKADATATDIQNKHDGKEQKQPQHPDNVKLKNMMSDEQLETETEYNYHGGRSLGFWEGRASAFDSMLAVVHRTRKAGDSQ